MNKQMNTDLRVHLFGPSLAIIAALAVVAYNQSVALNEANEVMQSVASPEEVEKLRAEAGSLRIEADEYAEKYSELRFEFNEIKRREQQWLSQESDPDRDTGYFDALRTDGE